jgi:polar amino acid transport system substrate-binding protein
VNWRSTKAVLVFLLMLAALPATAASKLLRIGFHPGMAPWVMADGNRGIAVEILRDLLAEEGYRLEVVQWPFARRLQAYRLGQLDGLYAVNNRQQQMEQLHGSISRSLHSFDNVAVSIAHRAVVLDEPQDLSRWRVLAWQGAAAILPANYDFMTAVAEGRYHEVVEQDVQLPNLFSGRTDVILGDRLIMQWNLARLQKANGRQELPRLALHGLLPPNEAGVLLRDSILRARLDSRISQLRHSSRYNQYFSRYRMEPQP